MSRYKPGDYVYYDNGSTVWLLRLIRPGDDCVSCWVTMGVSMNHGYPVGSKFEYGLVGPGLTDLEMFFIRMADPEEIKFHQEKEMIASLLK